MVEFISGFFFICLGKPNQGKVSMLDVIVLNTVLPKNDVCDQRIGLKRSRKTSLL